MQETAAVRTRAVPWAGMQLRSLRNKPFICFLSTSPRCKYWCFAGELQRFDALLKLGLMRLLPEPSVVCRVIHWFNWKGPQGSAAHIASSIWFDCGSGFILILFLFQNSSVWVLQRGGYLKIKAFRFWQLGSFLVSLCWLPFSPW